MIPSDHWYKNAVIYALDVETFQDSNGDGIGDFKGLIHRLDYLSNLGVTCLWLLPFYPSPMRDNGYDVTEYYGVDGRHGSLGMFVDFMREARERGMRVIVDLVANHTSNEHPWFQAARSDPKSRFRDWYVWRDDPEHPGSAHVVFPGEQESVWTYDEQAKSHYLHHFYEFQPDLNIGNPAVRDEIKRVMGFWLQLGVSGFRVDAAPFLIEDTTVRGGGPSEDGPGHELLSELREFLDRRSGDAILLAEANVPLESVGKYFGDGQRFQMLFNFLLNQQLFLALARQNAEPLQRAMREIPPIPPTCHWANFIRNHDELTLDKLTEAERQEVFKAFAPEESMRIYGRGIRRRLPPMLGGDQRRVAMVYSLLFTLPGTPIIRYGEEIGMGDDLSLSGRNAVRTPMQWTHEHNGGFSTAPPDRLARPIIASGPFGYQQVNVQAQERDRESMLSRIEQMIRGRKIGEPFGWGRCRVLETNQPAILAHTVSWDNQMLLAVHNLADRATDVRLDWGEEEPRRMTPMLSDGVNGDGAADLTTDRMQIGPYGYRWFQSQRTPAA